LTHRILHMIGGAGGIGRWLIEKVFSFTASIYCYDLNESALRSLPKTVNACALKSDSTYEKYKSNFKNNDWILLAVPMNNFEDTLEKIIAVIKDGSLVVSLTSVQAKAFSLLKKNVPKTSVFLGCHPLFGDTVLSPIGQLVALTGYNHNLSQHREFKKSLSDIGLITTELSADGHDQYMAVVQALTHFCLLSFVDTLAKNELHPSELLKISTPNFQFLYALASRVLKISTATTGSIQAMEGASKIREKFLNTAHLLHEKFQDKDDSRCAEIIEELRKPLTGAEVDEGVELAAVAVNSIQRFEELLYKYKTTGSPFVFRHRVTKKLHVVRIISINPKEVVFEESTQAVEFFKLTEQSCEELKMDGLSEDALIKLKKLQHQNIACKNKFLNDIKKAIGDKQTFNKYKLLILKHAKENNQTCFAIGLHENGIFFKKHGSVI